MDFGGIPMSPPSSGGDGVIPPRMRQPVCSARVRRAGADAAADVRASVADDATLKIVRHR
jgi:hypothetical protein